MEVYIKSRPKIKKIHQLEYWAEMAWKVTVMIGQKLPCMISGNWTEIALVAVAKTLLDKLKLCSHYLASQIGLPLPRQLKSRFEENRLVTKIEEQEESFLQARVMIVQK